MKPRRCLAISCFELNCRFAMTVEEPSHEAKAKAVNEIVAHLIRRHQDGKDVDLNRLKCVVSASYGLSHQPKLVDIIAAVPAEHRV